MLPRQSLRQLFAFFSCRFSPMFSLPFIMMLIFHAVAISFFITADIDSLSLRYYADIATLSFLSPPPLISAIFFIRFRLFSVTPPPPMPLTHSQCSILFFIVCHASRFRYQIILRRYVISLFFFLLSRPLISMPCLRAITIFTIIDMCVDCFILPPSSRYFLCF